MAALKTSDARVERVIAWYEALVPATLSQFDDLYAADAGFKDPFNEVRGRAAIRAIFEHMFRQVSAPRFVVHHAAVQGEVAFLTWTMFYGGAGSEQSIRGCTELRFDAEGRVALHRDYWDAAEELYEKLPLLGALMRAIKRRLKA